MQPITGLPSELRPEYEAISAFGCRPGEARKALHSEVIMAGWGTEISALFSEHGTNAILPGGVYSLAPFEYYLRVGRVALESIHQASGVEKLLSKLTVKLSKFKGVPAITTCNGEQISSDERETIELPGFRSLPLPSPEEWVFFGRVTGALERAGQPGLSRDELRRLLILCLLESGVPLKNLCRYRRYYRFGSFIFINEKPTFFVALIRQSDNGLGLMPIKLKRPELVARLLFELRRFFIPTSERAIFGDFEFNARTLGAFVERLVLPLPSPTFPSSLFGVLDRGATFTSMLEFGGFLTTALRDELLLPANYYHVGDLLDAMGFSRVTLMGIDGNTWFDPYAPTKTQLERALELGGVLALLAPKSDRNPGKGRPRKMPAKFRAIAQQYQSWPNRTWAAFVVYYWSQPSKSRIRRLLIESGTCDEKMAWPRAIKIFDEIRNSGQLASARPLRLLPPKSIMGFIEQVKAVYLPAAIRNTEKQRRMLALITSIAALGCRPQEGLRICQRDFTSSAGFRLLRLHGTKVHRARREPSLNLFAGGPGGYGLCCRFSDMVDLCSETIHQNTHPLFAGHREASGRYEKLNSVLRTAFAEYTGTDFAATAASEGSFTAYSLRHATAIRLVQSAIDEDFLYGNFQAALAESASALGHSYPVFLSAYVGTAALLLTWPTGPSLKP